MADSKINNLPVVLTDSQVNDSTRIFPLAHATSGIAGQATMGQVKKATSTQRKKYVASGSEGVTLTISELAAKEILMIAREGSVMYEVSSSPDSMEFVWDSTSITLGLAVQMAGERFLILYKNV